MVKYAWYPEYEKVNDTTKKQTRILAGQVNVVAYDKIMLDVCLVGVNGAVIPNPAYIQEELNKIYQSAIIQWKVSKLNNLQVTYDNFTGTFDNQNPNDNMGYTAHEKQVSKAMKDHESFNKKTYYLFFIGNKTTNAIKGYMPFNRQFGFIFTDNTRAEYMLHAIAHELGHGAFRLSHPYEATDQRMQTDDNLMAYNTSTRLYKSHWKECHDKDLGINWLEDAEEAYLLTDYKDQIKRILDGIHAANTNKQSRFNVEKLENRYNVIYSNAVLINGKTYEIAIASNSYITQINPSDYLVTPSGSAFKRKGKFRIIYFKDANTPKLTLNIVVNEKDVSEIGKYLLGNNWQEDFSPSDKMWVLYLHSPEQSNKFLDAHNENDLLEERRITYYALTNEFVDANGNESNWVQSQLETNPYNFSSTLKNNPKGSLGVTVYLSKLDENNFVVMKDEPIHFNPYKGVSKDAAFPLDIDLYDGPERPSIGKVKYKDYDFNGTFIEADASLGGTYGLGIIAGRMKGFGYLEFTYDVMGVSWPVGVGITGGLIDGKFIRQGGGIPSPNSFKGYGYVKFAQAEIKLGIGISTGKWYGVGLNLSDKTWSGNLVGVGLSIASPNLKGIWQNLTKAGGGEVQTRTELIYPKMSTKTLNILNIYYDTQK